MKKAITFNPNSGIPNYGLFRYTSKTKKNHSLH